MMTVEQAEATYEGLRERDRTIASLQSKQRMVPLFQQLLDERARAAVDRRLREALEEVRARARGLALDLARAAFVEIELDDLARISRQLRALESHLDGEPSGRLDACSDLLVFLRELRALKTPPSRRPNPYDEV